MDEFLRSFLLVMCGIGAVVLLVVTYLWYFVFGRSLRAVLMAGLSIMMNRDSTIDINADVEITKRPEDAKNEMAQEAEELDFHGEVAEHSQFVPQAMMNDGFSAQTLDSSPRKHELVSSSFESNRFRRVMRGALRPFLRSRLPKRSTAKSQNVQRGQIVDDNQ